MHTITITFNHLTAEPPKYTFGDRVAVIESCEPKAWAVGKVVGLELDETHSPRWWYLVWLDQPLGCTYEYLVDDLVSEFDIPQKQGG